MNSDNAIPSLEQQSSASSFLPITLKDEREFLYAANRRNRAEIQKSIDTFGPKIVLTEGVVGPSRNFLSIAQSTPSYTKGNALIQAAVGDIFHWIDNDKRAQFLPKIIDLLAQNGCDMNARSPNKQTALHHLLKQQQIEAAIHLAHAGCDVTALDDKGLLAEEYIQKHSQQIQVGEAFEKITPGYRNQIERMRLEKRKAPKLLVAALAEDKKSVKKYLKYIGPDVYIEKDGAKIPIFTKILLCGKKQIIKKFLKANVDIHKTFPSECHGSYYAPLLFRNDKELLSYFFEQGYSPNNSIPNLMKIEGNSKFIRISDIFWHSFVLIGNLEAVKICLQYGADLSLPMCNGFSIFELLQKEKDPRLITELEEIRESIISSYHQSNYDEEWKRSTKITPYLMALSEAYYLADSTDDPELYERALRDIRTIVEEKETKEMCEIFFLRTSNNMLRNSTLGALHGTVLILNSIEKLLSNDSPEHEAILELLEKHRDLQDTKN